MTTDRKRSRSGERGAVLAETAITIGLCLTLITFSIQVGLLGFLQETADAASFVYAHGNALGVNDPGGPAVAMNKVFPEIPVSDATSVPAPAPTPYVPVDYGYNGTASEQSQAQYNRHGGITEIQPQAFDSYVSKNNATTQQGFQIGVNSKNSEAYNRECTGHFNVAGSDVACGAGGPNSSNIDYITQGANTSPFYVGFNFQYHCADHRPWAATTCSNNNLYFESLGLGVAMYAHRTGNVYQHNQPDNQSDGTDNLTATGGGGMPGTGPGSTEGSFIAMACAERNLIWLASFFQAYTSLSSMYTYNYGSNNLNRVSGHHADGPNMLQTNQGNGAAANYNGIYFYMSNQDDNNNYGLITDPNRGMPFDPTTDQAISTLYTHDYDYITSGYSGGTFTHPGQFPLSNRSSCGYGPVFPGNAY